MSLEPEACVVMGVSDEGLYHQNGEVLLSGFENCSVAEAGHARQSSPSIRAPVKTQTWENSRGTSVRFYLSMELIQYLFCSQFTEQHWIL